MPSVEIALDVTKAGALDSARGVRVWRAKLLAQGLAKRRLWQDLLSPAGVSRDGVFWDYRV
jgi:hypothetical protein